MAGDLLPTRISGEYLGTFSVSFSVITGEHKGYAGVGFYFVHEFVKTVQCTSHFIQLMPSFAADCSYIAVYDLPGEGLGCLSAKGNGFDLFLAAVGLLVGLTSTSPI